MTLFGGIEAGGTKFICAVGSSPQDIRAKVKFATTTATQTLAHAIAFFKQQPEPIAAIGIGSFGPVDLDQASQTYGHITSTPKTGWQYTDIYGAIQSALNVPVGFDTDVNAAAIGEQRWGTGRDADNLLYLTVGTGIGGGVLVAGKPLHGAMHPEIGHIPVLHDWEDDPFPGICPYHGDCLEGLASGPAINARWRQPGEALPADHRAWALEARYLALALVSCIYALSPQRIILGGGVMQQVQLFLRIRAQVQDLLKGYLPIRAIQENIDDYIVPPALGSDAGVLGAIALAQEAWLGEDLAGHRTAGAQ